MENKTVVVLGASRYSFQNRDSNERIEGTKVHYLDLDKNDESDLKGYVPQTVNMPYEYFNKLPEIPGRYTLDISIDLKGKKASLKIEGFKFLEKIDFAQIQAAVK